MRLPPRPLCSSIASIDKRATENATNGCNALDVLQIFTLHTNNNHRAAIIIIVALKTNCYDGHQQGDDDVASDVAANVAF